MSRAQVGLIEKPHNLLELVPDIFVPFAQNYSEGERKKTKKTHETTLKL